MIISKKFFKDLYSNRRRFYVVFASTLLILMFQNCGGPGLNSGSTALSSTAPVGSAGNGGNTPATPGTQATPAVVPNAPPPIVPVVPVVGTAPVGLTLDQQRANCLSAISAPTISSVTTPAGLAADSAEISSGLGSNVSGDSKTIPSFDITINRGISNTEVFNDIDNRCDSHLNIELKCDVVETNPNNPTDSPLAIRNAYTAAGESLLTGAAMRSPIDIAKSAYLRNMCEEAFLPTSNKVNFQISPDSRTARCVEGNFWLKLTVSSEITGTQGTKDSVSKYFKVNMKNGCWVESRLKDSAGNLPSVVNFGTAVAINNNWAAVLAPTDDANATVLDVGSVYMYMYEGNNWVQKQKIMISDSASRESLASIALRGDTLIIGSPYRNGRGMAYFYRLTGATWTQIQQIDPPNVNANQAFGQTVTLSDRYVFVGAPNYSGSLTKAGAVSVYSYSGSGMSYVKTLFGGVANAAFGAAIAVDNQTLAVGAPQALGKEALAAGSVFIYNEATGPFNLIGTGTKTGTQAGEKFGASLALYGANLAVGSPNFAVSGKAGYGLVTYYADASSTTKTKTFQGGAEADNLGQSVALSNTGLYIGVPFANARAGRVDHYLYADILAGNLYFRNLAYNQTGNSAYGYAVAASGNNIIIGARIKNDPNDNSGAAYIYRFK